MSRRAAMVVGICIAAAAAVGSVAVTRDAGAPAVRPVTGPAELERVGGEALRLVTFDPGRVGYAIRFAPGRDGIRAQVDRTTATIGVFLRDGDAPHVVAHDIAHELGHAYDQTRMDDAARRAYLERRGVPGADWWPSGASDYAVGAGDFAEVFALCHSGSPEFRGELAPRPEDACALLPDGAL